MLTKMTFQAIVSLTMWLAKARCGPFELAEEVEGGQRLCG